MGETLKNSWTWVIRGKNKKEKSNLSSNPDKIYVTPLQPFHAAVKSGYVPFGNQD